MRDPVLIQFRAEIGSPGSKLTNCTGIASILSGNTPGPTLEPGTELLLRVYSDLKNAKWNVRSYAGLLLIRDIVIEIKI